MEAQVSEILENILGLLALEGSFEVEEGPEEVTVSIEATDPGRLIGYRGETLDALQLLVNQIVSKKVEVYKRVVIDVEGWRKNKEADLERRARNWIEEVKQSKADLELEPMPSWQRRIVHMIVSEETGVESESVGEGRDRHLVIRIVGGKKESSGKSLESSELKESDEPEVKEEVDKTDKAEKPVKKPKKAAPKTSKTETSAE